MESNTKNILIAGVAGLALGAIAAVLLAPAKGSDTRAAIADKASDLRDAAVDFKNQVKDKAGDLKDQLISKTNHLINK